MSKQPIGDPRSSRNQTIANEFLLKACLTKLFSQSTDPKSVSREIIKSTEDQISEVEQGFVAKSQKDLDSLRGDANEIRQIIQQVMNLSLADYRKNHG